MRKLGAAGAAIVMCLALGAMPVAGQESSAQPSAATPTIGFTNYFTDGGFFSGLEEGALEAATAAGVELLVETAQGSATTQASQVNDFIESSVDAIIITPIDPDAIVASVEAANAAGIPVLAVDRAASGGTVASVIASDNVAAGRMAGEALFEVMGGSGKVIEIQGDMAVSSGSLRSEGFGEALAAAPDITLAVQAPAYFDYGTALQATQEALEGDPEITGVFASNLDMLYGAAAGVSAADRQGVVGVVGVDVDPDILAMVKDGSIDATVAQQPRLMGQRAVEAALAVIAGEPVEPFIPVETILVTQDNVDEFLTGEAVPAEPAQGEAASPVPVAVDTMLTCTYSWASSAYEGVVQQLRGGEFACDVTADDARLAGPMILQVSCDCTSAGCSCWGATDGPQNDGGGWVGYMVSAEPNGAAPATVWVSEGTGSYEGWTWVETHQPTGDMVYEGTAMVYPGAPPLWAPLPSNE